jgi:pimeloyl-ACP methyl ester carboxylesterase
MSCTIVLVHGAFAESASWDRVIDPLVAEGHRVVAAANPLRSLSADAAAVSDLVRTIEGPVVLVEPSGERPLWKDVPSWFLIGEEDRIIPAELQRYMAERARAQRTLAIEGASHAIPVSRPDATVHPILEAAALRVAA